MVKVGDGYILHSDNGMDYRIVIININHYREPNAIYGAIMCDNNGIYAEDIIFFGNDFINKCEKINNVLEWSNYNGKKE